MTIDIRAGVLHQTWKLSDDEVVAILVQGFQWNIDAATLYAKADLYPTWEFTEQDLIKINSILLKLKVNNIVDEYIKEL